MLASWNSVICDRFASVSIWNFQMKKRAFHIQIAVTKKYLVLRSSLYLHIKFQYQYQRSIALIANKLMSEYGARKLVVHMMNVGISFTYRLAVFVCGVRNEVCAPWNILHQSNFGLCFIFFVFNEIFQVFLTLSLYIYLSSSNICYDERHTYWKLYWHKQLKWVLKDQTWTTKDPYFTCDKENTVKRWANERTKKMPCCGFDRVTPFPRAIFICINVTVKTETQQLISVFSVVSVWISCSTEATARRNSREKKHVGMRAMYGNVFVT